MSLIPHGRQPTWSHLVKPARSQFLLFFSSQENWIGKKSFANKSRPSCWKSLKFQSQKIKEESNLRHHRSKLFLRWEYSSEFMTVIQAGKSNVLSTNSYKMNFFSSGKMFIPFAYHPMLFYRLISFIFFLDLQELWCNREMNLLFRIRVTISAPQLTKYLLTLLLVFSFHTDSFSLYNFLILSQNQKAFSYSKIVIELSNVFI